jgi:ubiquinone/menaquinone biosynthesis C-methylase UbiE
MALTEPFDTHSTEYEDWFEKHRFAYLSELEAVRTLLPKQGRGVEIGVGTGRFATPFGIDIGVEPSASMRRIAQQKGVQAVNGVAEKLPFAGAQFDYALMVTTICFVDDAKAALAEAYRILKNRGRFVVGIVDRRSPLGALYERTRSESAFYKVATFYSVEEVIALLCEAGFKNLHFAQTIFHMLSAIISVEPVKEGFGQGSFVVLGGEK